ncbi:MAG: manganese catalase family protein [Clostridia bacterium]|nr:manganese catalase family protein [Clostridia bacterium]
MWIYEKKLQHPVKIANPNPRLAGIIITALGGPDGELAAATRYLNQRYSMPDGRVIGVLTDVGSEELGHMEMVAAIVYQLTRNLTPEEIRAGGFDKYFVDHGAAIYPSSAAGVPFNAMAIASKEDALASITEDLAADAAILQEQLITKNRRKPLKYKNFSHLGKTLKNRYPAII